MVIFTTGSAGAEAREYAPTREWLDHLREKPGELYLAADSWRHEAHRFTDAIASGTVRVDGMAIFYRTETGDEERVSYFLRLTELLSLWCDTDEQSHLDPQPLWLALRLAFHAVEYPIKGNIRRAVRAVEMGSILIRRIENVANVQEATQTEEQDEAAPAEPQDTTAPLDEDQAPWQEPPVDPTDKRLRELFFKNPHLWENPPSSPKLGVELGVDASTIRHCLFWITEIKPRRSALMKIRASKGVARKAERLGNLDLDDPEAEAPDTPASRGRKVRKAPASDVDRLVAKSDGLYDIAPDDIDSLDEQWNGKGGINELLETLGVDDDRRNRIVKSQNSIHLLHLIKEIQDAAKKT